MIVKLIDQGLSVARLNFNHGDHEKQGKIFANVR
jgi:pyruvate kinase